jgi:hypothetical protein
VSDYVEKIVRYGRAPASPLLPMMLFSWHSCHQALARVDRGLGRGDVAVCMCVGLCSLTLD